MSVQDKTEAPSSKRREDTRNKGNVAKSMDLNSALVLLICLLVIKASGGFMVENMAGMLRDTLSNLGQRPVTPDTIFILAASYGTKALMTCAPVLLTAGAIGFGVNVMQVGLKFTPKAIAPDFSKMDPVKGMSRMLSIKGLVELIKSLVKIGIVGYVIYTCLQTELPNMNRLADMSLNASSMVILGICWQMIMRACVAMLAIALIDYGYQRYQFEGSLKMTKQEVKDEFRLQEGDPQIKARVRQRQREMLKLRMMQNIPKADVIITNPTHLAIAIQYDADSMSAPTVVAKGQRLMAEKIKQIAAANGVPIVENKPVARALYKAVEIGGQVPEDLFQAVAEILAYVYRLSEKRGRSRRVAAG